MLVIEQGAAPDGHNMIKQHHCCCSLKTATLIIGVILVISCAVSVITSIVALSVGDNVRKDAFNPQGKPLPKRDYVLSLAITLMILLNSCILVYGALTENKKYLVPWLISIGSLIIILLCGVIYTSVSSNNSLCLLAVVLAGVFGYFWFCVLGFYNNIQSNFEIC